MVWEKYLSPLWWNAYNYFILLSHLNAEVTFVVKCIVILSLLRLRFVITSAKTSVYTMCGKFKRYVLNSVESLEDDRYKLTFYINGECMHTIVKPSNRKIEGVYNYDYETCITDKALPYLHYVQDSIKPKDFDESEINIVYDENDRLTIVDQDSDNSNKDYEEENVEEETIEELNMRIEAEIRQNYLPVN